LARPKFAFRADEIEALIEVLRKQGEEIHDPAPLDSHLPDPGTKSFWRALKPQGSISS
jgi:hypothetical protein